MPQYGPVPTHNHRTVARLHWVKSLLMVETAVESYSRLAFQHSPASQSVRAANPSRRLLVNMGEVTDLSQAELPQDLPLLVGPAQDPSQSFLVTDSCIAKSSH